MNSENFLPIKDKLLFVYITSLVIILLTGVASISGILYRDVFYPTEALIQTFLPNDIINLFIGIPILFLSVLATRRAKVIGLLFWEGAIGFSLYIYISYIFALPFSWGFLIHLCLVVLSLYSLIKLIISIEGQVLEIKLRGRVYEKFCGGFLIIIGVLFLLRAFLVITSAIINGEILTEIELAPNISDLIIAPAYVIVGIALWRKKALGYVGGLGLLFLANMLFVGLIIFLLLQPVLTGAPFLLNDFLFIVVMGLTCFVPIALFARGVALSYKSIN